MLGARADMFKIISVGGDVPDLAARPDGLAVQLHPEPPIPGEAVHQRG